MHPHTRSTFDVWIRKLDDRGFLSAKKLKKRGLIFMMQCLRAGRNLMLTSAKQSWDLCAKLIILHPQI